MGMIIGFTCDECGFYHELLKGGGMRFHGEDTLLEVLPERERGKVKALLGQEDAEIMSYEYSVFYCPDCELPQSHLDFQISLGDGEIYQPDFKCLICRGPLEKEDEVRFLKNCPRCGSERILESTGEWD